MAVGVIKIIPALQSFLLHESLELFTMRAIHFQFRYITTLEDIWT